jgi:CRISPR-associated endonuclease/helicase Cas3
MNLTADDFSAFFSAIRGYEPFPWQQRLATQLAAEGKWPKILALPTSSGKTSVIDLAVYMLALQSGRPRHERTAPLRIFFIIDRRIVVDEAGEHARKLANALQEAIEQPETAKSIVHEVAQRLCLYHGEKRPLHVVALRGGMYCDENWTRSPNMPTVCLSTVDQIGSRLLFRGYGLNEYQWPIHAGLIGSDALLILDEAHLSNPFLETLQAIERYQTWTEQSMPITHPWGVVHMTATPSTDGEKFALEDADYQHAELSKRLKADKLAELQEAPPGEFETTVVKHACELAENDKVQVIGIVVNRVASARQIFETLRQAHQVEAVLLTGRVRPFDRDRLLEKWLEKMRAGRNRAINTTEKLFVVATQTVEVGANLDFDALVTEAASLDALRQRFGRLDRLGELQSTQAVIVLRKEPKESKVKVDPIYGKALNETWSWLKNNLHRVEKQRVFNFGVSAFSVTMQHCKGAVPHVEPKHAPIMFPAHVDTWVQTSPTPHADPDPAFFLHGSDALACADVQLVWRADLDTVSNTQWAEVVALAPPVVREALPIPMWTARAWLSQVESDEVADLEGISRTEQTIDGIRRVALRWRGPEEEESRVIGPNQIVPGDTLIMPASYGGADEYGWNPSSVDLVIDINDQCANEIAYEFAVSGATFGQRPYRLRLSYNPEGIDESKADIDEQVIDNLLQAYLANAEGFNAQAAQALLAAPKKRKLLLYPPDTVKGFILLLYPTSRKVYTAGDIVSATLEASSNHTDSDDTASTIGVPVTLSAHCYGVGGWARRFAEGCGLPQALVADLELAGRLHDLGKADRRFQIWLHCGDEIAEAMASEPLAKSGMQSNDRMAMRTARERSGYPAGARHELLSVALVKDNAGIRASANDWKLVLHLVGTHHGRARPFPPVVADPHPIEVCVEAEGQTLTGSSMHGLEHLESGWLEQFWALVQRYGAWGLAYLEALLRLADYARSAEEQARDGN